MLYVKLPPKRTERAHLHRFTCLVFTLLIFSVTTLAADVKFGIDVLRESNFEALADKRVGLVVNPASVDSRLMSTVDVLANQKR